MARAALESHVYEQSVEAKVQEWDEHRLQATRWEVERYLRMY